MKYLLVYGSLKRNGFNYNRFSGQNYIKDVLLEGFDMYDLGSYPAVCKGNGIIKCELHSIEEKSFKQIQNMEKWAGYEELTFPVKGITKEVSVFIMPKENLVNCKKIECGNWT